MSQLPAKAAMDLLGIEVCESLINDALLGERSQKLTVAFVSQC